MRGVQFQFQPSSRVATIECVQCSTKGREQSHARRALTVEQASSSTPLDCTECDACGIMSSHTARSVRCTCRAWRKSGLACSSFGLKTRGAWLRLVHQHGWSAWAYMEHVRLGNRSVRWTPCSMYRSRLGASEHRAVATNASLGIGHASAAQGARGAHGQLDLSVRMSSCWAAWPWPFSLASLSRPFSLLPCLDPEAVCIPLFVF